jgi:hypothetical protein
MARALQSGILISVVLAVGVQTMGPLTGAAVADCGAVCIPSLSFPAEAQLADCSLQFLRLSGFAVQISTIIANPQTKK